MSSHRAIVIGCGVSGLSCALRLLEGGFEVEIWTRDDPLRTTSGVAGAIWYPYKVGPADAVARWARASYVEFERLARVADSGVLFRRGVELVPAGAPDEAAEYRRGTRGLRRLSQESLPDGFERGFELQVPVVEMPLYLEYLLRRFQRGGGSLQERTVARFDEALEACPLVINTTGLDSRELAGDREMVAIRGQIVRVERGAIERFVLDDYDPRGVTYVVPRSQDCILGGTTDVGREDLVPDEADTRAILARCGELEPELRDARVLSVAVGLRPGRSSVRLERERRGERTLIHDYGHGGAGVTLSWGCADDVLVLARR